MKHNTEQIKVSVIVLCYNQRDFIEKALDSIINQKVDFKYEILVGDDASTDGTDEILLGYEKESSINFNLFIREHNIGSSRNIFELLLSAKGEYIFVLEGDDFWISTDKMQTQVNFLQENKEFIACSHKFNIVDCDGNMTYRQRLNWVRYKEIFTFDDFQGLYLPGQISTLCLKNIFLNTNDKYSYIYKIDKYISDRTIILTLLLEGNIYTFNRNMSCYRKLIKDDFKANCTTMLYNECENKIYREININKFLENICKKRIHQDDFSFDLRRKQIFADAIIQFFKKITTDSFRMILESYKDLSNKLELILFLPSYFLSKIYYKDYTVICCLNRKLK